MSVTPELRASARSTYRLLFRTAARTFSGDDRVLDAFRKKIRTDFKEGRSVADSKTYTARIQLGREIADVLKKNVVQGVRINPEVDTNADSLVQNAEGIWRLRLTEDTELGSNETIKNAIKNKPRPHKSQRCCSSPATSTPAESTLAVSDSYLPPERDELFSNPDTILESTHKNEFIPGEQDELLIEDENEVDLGEEETSVTDGEQQTQTQTQTQNRRLNYSALKRASQNRVRPVLDENDLEESFVRGSGPGGQSINKTSNNVQLLHKPTGIRVTCQETRSLQQNRLIARKNLVEKLDQLANPGLSKENMRRAKQVERERRRKKKAKKKKKGKEQMDEEEEEV
ncbi:hypothetical protein PNOK_0140500 [Pyrrhoderma noxium]|uniref:Uncharacterized protein n=1 Tax=Pyrrhoderma noxium TaxID=2282107 RepID=A0A286UXM1_9AGAM|nr:hypothetical protein PNOK_0140500 [Pyrrhoderma noxium]